MILLSLNVQQVDLILKSLGELPWRVSNETLQDVIKQIQAQQKSDGEKKPEKPKKD